MQRCIEDFANTSKIDFDQSLDQLKLDHHLEKARFETDFHKKESDFK